MVKRIMVFSLPEGTDAEEFWQFWAEKHTDEVVKNWPAVRKYVVNRVIEVVSGQPKFWGLVELWFDSKEAYNQSQDTMTPAMKHIRDDFSSRVVDRFAVWAEEKVIV